MQMRRIQSQSDSEEAGREASAAVAHAAHSPAAAVSHLQVRLAELEVENARLQQLVTELLFKNQELRKLLCQ